MLQYRIVPLSIDIIRLQELARFRFSLLLVHFTAAPRPVDPRPLDLYTCTARVVFSCRSLTDDTTAQ